MKYLLFSALWLLAFTFYVEAQQIANVPVKKDWITIQSEDKKLSLDFPSDMLIDTEKSKKGPLLWLHGYNNGVIMELRVFTKSNLYNYLYRTAPVKNFSIQSFKKDEFNGTRSTEKSFGGQYMENISIYDKKRYYSIGIRAEEGMTDEIGRFFSSIKINGKPLFSNLQEPPKSSKTVSLEMLRTSSEILEALKDRVTKYEGKVSQETVAPESVSLENTGLTRYPVIVEIKSPFRTPVIRGENLKIVNLKVSLLANGQVGDIWVYSNANQDFIDDCVDVIKKLKFVPAQRNGKNVDSF